MDATNKTAHFTIQSCVLIPENTYIVIEKNAFFITSMVRRLDQIKVVFKITITENKMQATTPIAKTQTIHMIIIVTLVDIMTI